ncbi:Leucine-rich repeat-containing protein 27 [Bagarius yarrelli]|uniref:Leucine-rich repeat-containing protein 27 n=1 Tax=Bagarius yarrelli TaxID=175774 RepID=A0A556TMP9_BAGYA|nr:Leucine-rich repeat-containing protein 27 [Bagarius yarrelli]
MMALEGKPGDLNFSPVCGENALKSASRNGVRRSADSSEHQMNHDSDILYLSRQKLKVIPDYVCKCTSLKNLYLEGNDLSRLPDNLFSSLPHLLWLDLRNNQLTCLPADIGQHRCLKTLLLEGNPIPELPVELGSAATWSHTHILQFLRRTAVAQRPLTWHNGHTALDMPAVEKLPLSDVLQSSMDLSEVDENEAHRFKELRQQVIQADKADLGPITPVIFPQHQLRTAEGDRSHQTHSPSAKRPQELTRGMFQAPPPSDVRSCKRSEDKRLAAIKELNEKHALIEQKRKNEELLQKWRNQAKIMQEKKILEHRQDQKGRHWKEERLENVADTSSKPNSTADALNNSLHSEAQNTQQTSFKTCKEKEKAREAKDRELEQRIKAHIQMMQQRRMRPRGSPAEEAKAAAQEMDEVRRLLQVELAERRRVKDLEYRFSAFTGEITYDK